MDCASLSYVNRKNEERETNVQLTINIAQNPGTFEHDSNFTVASIAVRGSIEDASNAPSSLRFITLLFWSESECLTEFAVFRRFKSSTRDEDDDDGGASRMCSGEFIEKKR